jgi:hypothetical protein
MSDTAWMSIRICIRIETLVASMVPIIAAEKGEK